MMMARGRPGQIEIPCSQSSQLARILLVTGAASFRSLRFRTDEELRFSRPGAITNNKRAYSKEEHLDAIMAASK